MKRFGWLFFAHLLLSLSPSSPPLQALQGAPPTTPTGLQGVAQSTDSIQWSWNPSTGSSIITYELHADPETSPPTVVASGLSNPSYLETGLNENTRYARHVHAKGSDGSLSPASDPARRYTWIHTAQTSDFSVHLSSDTSSVIDVVQPPNAFADQTGVEIFRTVPTFLMISAMSQNYQGTENGLAPDKDYCYNIEFQNGDGIRSGAGPSPLCVHTPPTETHDDGCHVHRDNPVLCPNHDSCRFEWDVKIETPGKAAVIAYSDTQLVLVQTGSGVIEITKRRPPRNNVKERIRGWCRVYATVAEANDAAKKVKDQFAIRKTLIDQHRELRDQIIKQQEKMDKEREDFYKTELELIKKKDKAEAAALAVQDFGDMMTSRRSHLIKDQKDVEKLQKELQKLQGIIDNLGDSEDKPIEKIEKEVDPKVSAILGAPVECIVAEIAKVEFEKISRDLDANPLWGGGQRIRPDANDINDGPSTDVMVKATATPKIPGLSVHFKRFDRDDPGSDHSSLDENGTAGDDNFGSKKLGQPWGFGGAMTTNGVTDAQGECKKIFQVTMQPGDNFEAAAACDPGDIDPLDDNAASQYKVPHRLSTGMLTVWRRIFFELESMGSPQEATPRYIVPGTAGPVTVSADQTTAVITFTPQDSAMLGESPNRWVPGRYKDVTKPGVYEIVSTALVGQALQVTVKTQTDKGPQKTLLYPAPNSQGRLYDDDFEFGKEDQITERNVLPMLPDLSELKATYEDAYLDIIGNVPGFAASEQGQTNLPPRVNFLRDSFPEDTEESAQLNNYINANFGSKDSRKDSCWIGYLLAAFQGDLQDDHDPEGPDVSATFGMNASSGQLAEFGIGSAAYMETSRDKLTMEKLLASFEFLAAKTHSHEFGHQMGLKEKSGGIMRVSFDSGGSKDPNVSSPLTYPHMHKIRRYAESPGKRSAANPD